MVYNVFGHAGSVISLMPVLTEQSKKGWDVVSINRVGHHQYEVVVKRAA